MTEPDADPVPQPPGVPASMSQAPAPAAKPEGKGGRLVLALILGFFALIGGGYVAAHAAAGDRLPKGTTIAGVKVGGLDPAGAESALREGLADLVGRPIKVSVGTQDGTVLPADAGFAVDYAASVSAAGGGRSWSPTVLWNYFTGGKALDAVVTDDPAKLTSTLDGLTEQFGTAPKDATVAFEGTEIKTTKATSGHAVDPDQAATALQAAFLADDPVAVVPLVATPADITDAEAQQFVSDFANPAVAAPVTLRFGKSAIVLRPADYTAALTVVAADGGLIAQIDDKALIKLVDAQVGEAGAPVDATVAMVSGKPQVVPGKPGVGYRPKQVVKAFTDAVGAAPGDRSASVPSSVAQPDFTTKDAEALKITEQVSTFTTYYPYAPYRNINIPRAAQLVNGTVIKPGETFSLNDTVGERTRANGFTEGFIISNGIFKEDLGGGVSQMATTTFNAAFFGGMTDVEHKPHSFYIDRYPVGREATVAWGAVDLRWRNDTPYGVLVDAHVTPATSTSSGVVTVSLWSTKYWDITTKTGERYNLTPPQTRTLDTVDCYPNTGYGGFDIDIWRYWHRAGSSTLERTEKMHTTYTPSDTVICTNPAAAGG